MLYLRGFFQTPFSFLSKVMKAKKLNKTIPDSIHFTLAKSDPLDFPSEKSFLLLFAHEKGLQNIFQK